MSKAQQQQKYCQGRAKTRLFNTIPVTLEQPCFALTSQNIKFLCLNHFYFLGLNCTSESFRVIFLPGSLLAVATVVSFLLHFYAASLAGWTKGTLVSGGEDGVGTESKRLALRHR